MTDIRRNEGDAPLSAENAAVIQLTRKDFDDGEKMIIDMVLCAVAIPSTAPQTGGSHAGA